MTYLGAFTIKIVAMSVVITFFWARAGQATLLSCRPLTPQPEVSAYAEAVDGCPTCGHRAKVPRLTMVDRLWGLRPYCPVRVVDSERLRPVCGCIDPWHMAGT